MDLTWITPQLAVGGCYERAEIPHLASAGVTAVVDLREEDCDDEVALSRQGIRLLHLPTPDNQALAAADLARGAAWVQDELARGGRVFIHCQYGIGRSVILTCAVLAGAAGGAEQALAQVRLHRWQAAPNARQLAALYTFCQAQSDGQVLSGNRGR